MGSEPAPSPASQTRRAAILAALAGLSALLAAVFLLRDRPAPAAGYAANVVDYLSAATGQEGFARVLGPRPFIFPADAGPHPEYQTEWWYYTGNLADAAGRRYGYQLTFFRRALTPQAPERGSAWASHQVYLAHFAVTDVAGGAYHSAERLARGAAGLAGAQAQPFRVWVADWSASAGGPPEGAVHLLAADAPVAIDLQLRPAKAPVGHGRQGYSPKGPEPGNASHYYSFTRLETSGTVSTASGAHPVTGLSWMDHEWSTSALASDQVGWDWFSLQLDDGRELMLFQIRETDGGLAANSSGSLVGAEGAVTALDRAAFSIQPTGRWTSPRTGGVYPAGWRVEVPDADLELTVTPLLADQELSVALRYWEGAVRVSGSASGRPLTGHGYVELTGYIPAGAGGPRLD